MKEINKNVEEVRSIYADILSLNLQELIIKCREYEINIKYNNLHGLDMVIDELVRKICSERNIPTLYEDDLYFGVEYDLNQSIWFNY